MAAALASQISKDITCVLAAHITCPPQLPLAIHTCSTKRHWHLAKCLPDKAYTGA